MAYQAGIVYGDGTNSTMGTQYNTFYWQKKALVDKKLNEQ